MAIFLQLVAGLAISLTLGWLSTKSQSVASKITRLLSVALFLLVLWLGIRELLTLNKTGRIDRYHAVVAYTLGHAVARDCAAKSGSIYLLFPKPTRSNSEALDTAFNTTSRVLVPFPNLQLKELDVAQFDPAKPTSKPNLEDMEQALASMENCIALVSFIGLPDNPDRLSIFKKPNAPLVYVYDATMGTHWTNLLAQARLQAVVIPKADKPNIAELKGPPEEIFSRMFILMQSGK